MRTLTLIIGLSLIGGSVRAQDARPIVLILADSAAEDAKASASAVSYFADALDRYQVWDVLSGAELKMLLEAAQMRAEGGCDTDQCMMEIGAALGGEYLLSVGVYTLGEGKELRARLLAIEAARSVARAGATVPSLARLRSVTQRLTPRLVAPLLDGRSGTLTLSLSEAGVRMVRNGTEQPEPLAQFQRLSLPIGPHELELKKPNFQPLRLRVDIREGEQSQMARLIPDNAWLEEARRVQSRQRLLAWGFGAGAAAASLAALVQQQRLDAEVAERSRLLSECCFQNAAGDWAVTSTGAVAWRRHEDRLRALDDSIPNALARAQGLALAGALMLPVTWYFTVTQPDLERFNDL